MLTIRRPILSVAMAVSELTYTSTWVDWELEESINKGSTIICMGLPNGPQNIRLPEPAKRLNLPWYLWDYERLGRLIAAAP